MHENRIVILCILRIEFAREIDYNITIERRWKTLEDKIKKLSKLVAQLEKLVIRIISIAGWILILIKMLD